MDDLGDNTFEVYAGVSVGCVCMNGLGGDLFQGMDVIEGFGVAEGLYVVVGKSLPNKEQAEGLLLQGHPGWHFSQGFGDV